MNRQISTWVAFSRKAGAWRTAGLASAICVLLAPAPATAADGLFGLSSSRPAGWQLDAYTNIELLNEDNFDLDKGDDDNELSIETEFGLYMLSDPEKAIRALVQVEAARKHFLDKPAGVAARPWMLNIKQAYVDLALQDDDAIVLRVGRQSFDDEMEWIFDEDLDAVRLFAKSGDWDGELSISREHLFDKDLLNNDKRDEIDNVFFRVGNEFASKSRIDGYVFSRNACQFGTAPLEDLLFFGVQSLGQLGSGGDTRYWLNAAYVTGNNEGRGISGFGVDAGVIHVLDHALKPSFVLGVAYGSGDEDDAAGKDSNFRQSGLQDNSWHFNGVASFHYLGEVLEPELSNMTILTAAVGFRPTDKSSVDLVYHYYLQNEQVDELRDTNLDIDPNGDSRDLGHGLDLIIGYDEIENLQIDGVLGVFLPGRAFDNADPAFVGSIEFKLAL